MAATREAEQERTELWNTLTNVKLDVADLKSQKKETSETTSPPDDLTESTN